MQGDGTAGGVALDDGIQVAFAQEPGDPREPHRESVHVPIRSVLQYLGNRMILCVLEALAGHHLDALGERRDILGEQLDGCIDGREAQRRILVHYHSEIDAISAPEARERRNIADRPAANRAQDTAPKG